MKENLVKALIVKILYHRNLDNWWCEIHNAVIIHPQYTVVYILHMLLCIFYDT